MSLKRPFHHASLPSRPRPLSCHTLCLLAGICSLALVSVHMVASHFNKEHTSMVTGRLAVGGSAADVDRGASRSQEESFAKLIYPEAFRKVPHTMNSSYRNPCWLDSEDGRLLCLPAFYVLGVWQAGVRDLQVRLDRHPQVKWVSAYNYWFEEHPFEAFLDALSPGFDKIALEPSTSIIGDAAGGTFTFCWAHTSDVYHPDYRATVRECWPACAQNASLPEEGRHACEEECLGMARAADDRMFASLGRRMETPHLLHAIHGDALRLVVLLRDPVMRLHSAFWHYPQYTLHYGASEAGFLKYVEEQVGAFERCQEEFSPRACALYFETLGTKYEAVFYHADQVIKSLYSVFLESWRGVFDSGQILVVKAEDYYEEPRQVLKAIFQHLRLEEPSEPDWEYIMHGPVEMVGMSKAEHHKEMLPEAEALLRKFFAPFNKRLAEMLGQKKFLWMKGR